MKTVVGLFDDHGHANQAVEGLQKYGIDSKRISVVTRENNGMKHGNPTAGTGAVAGAATGGLVGLIAGLSALVIPGIGPVIATGAVASALATTVGITAVGAGVGAVTGGLLGALINSGYSHADAEFYAEGVKRGGVLIAVETDSQYEDQIRNILRDTGAVDMNSRRQTWQNEGWTRFEEREVSDEDKNRRPPSQF